MQPTVPAPTTYRADEQLAQHLLSTGFYDRTEEYFRQRGYLTAYHGKRDLTVRLSPGNITVLGGGSAPWKFEGSELPAGLLTALIEAALPYTRPPR